ncbi:MAG: hypothetical protein GX620_02140 [Chloroflexi bacterium]|nr:hypothetical protein [Chloroflexota bacterium]
MEPMAAMLIGVEPQPGSGDSVPRWLWTAGVAGMALALGAMLTLLALLTAGWNSPRPVGPPDWQVAGQSIVLEAPLGETVLHLLPWSGDDFALEAVAECLSGPSFNGLGLVFRAQDTEVYDVFAVGGDGYLAVLHFAGGVVTPLLPWQQFPHIRRGASENRLRLSCSQATCRFYVNDEYVDAVEYDATAGSIGVWATSPSDAQVTAAFTAIQVWEGVAPPSR